MLWEKFDSWKKGNLDTEGRLCGYTKKTLCGDGGLEWCIHKPRNTCGYQKLEERRGTDSSLVPSEGAWPHQFLDVVLPASRMETINLCRFKPIQGERGFGGSNSCYPAHRDGRPGVLWVPRGDVLNPLQWAWDKASWKGQAREILDKGQVPVQHTTTWSDILGRSSSKYRKTNMWESRVPSGNHSRLSHGEYGSVSKWQEKRWRGRQGLIHYLHWMLCYLNKDEESLEDSKWGLVQFSNCVRQQKRAGVGNCGRITGIPGSQLMQQCTRCCDLSPCLVVQVGKSPKGRYLEWSEIGVSSWGGGTKGAEEVRRDSSK